MLEDFLIKLIDALPIALVALPFGWLGSLAQSYFSAKGKNLATKEDIEEITKKVEAVKLNFINSSTKSSALINRKIQAFDSISRLLSEAKIYCLHQSDENDYAADFPPHQSEETQQKGVALREEIIKNQILLSDSLCENLFGCTHQLFELADKEKDRKPFSREYDVTREHITKTLNQMKKELFGDD